MNDCISCGLTLLSQVPLCPACGTEQSPQLAKSEDARCSIHLETQATGACMRCGRFMCVECAAVDAGVCRSCVEQVRRDVRSRLEALNVRLGWVAVLQGLVGPAIAFGKGPLFVLLAVTGAFSVVFGLITIARRELWIVSGIACVSIAFFSFFALFDVPLLFVCVTLALLEWRLITRSGHLEREVWLLGKRRP